MLLALATLVAAHAADPVRLLLVGDTGMPIRETCARKPTRNVDLCAPQHEALVGRMLTLDADAVIAAGDLYYAKGKRQGTAAEVRARVEGWFPPPMRKITVPIAGNHEYSDQEPGAALAAMRDVFGGGVWNGELVGVYRWPVDGGDACVVVGTWDAGAVRSWVDPHLPPAPADCVWTVVATHHVWATSYDKTAQQRQAAGAITEAGALAVSQLGRPPDVWLAGHAHVHEGGLYAVTRPEGDFRLLNVTSGTGSHVRCPKTAIATSDGRTVLAAPGGCDGKYDATPGLAPTYVVLEKGFTDVVIDGDVIVVTPWAVSDTPPHAVTQRGCWRMERGASELVPCGW